MRLPSTRSNPISRSTERNRGSLLVDATVAFVAVTIVAGSLVEVVRAQREAVAHSSGTPYMQEVVDSDLYGFANSTTFSAPSVSPSVSGTTDFGETLQSVRSTSFNSTLGLRCYAVGVFVPGTARSVMGGAARIEPIDPTAWIPDCSDVSVVPSTHTLILQSAVPAGGAVNGGGSFAFGATVPITATAYAGYAFSGWTGTAIVASASSASTTVTIDEDRTLVANFTK